VDSMFRFIRNALLIGAALIGVISVCSYYNTGRFWLPSFLISGSRSVADVVSEIPITTSTKTPTFNSVSLPTEPSYKWLKNGSWHYGSIPPKGVNAIKISKSAK
jgi:hypothetical protein